MNLREHLEPIRAAISDLDWARNRLDMECHGTNSPLYQQLIDIKRVIANAREAYIALDRNLS